MTKNIIIDVGANFGLFTFPIAKYNPDKTILVFEPIPNLINYLSKSLLENNLTNVILRSVALSNWIGNTVLHVSPNLDFGVSSLLDFNDKNILNNDYWRKRTDLKFSSEIQVTVTTLESELENIDFDRIRFMKIDSQGLDIEILSSLGRYLSKLDAGMLEVPATFLTSLYSNEKFDLYKAIEYIKNIGFDIYKIKPNDEYCNEFNIFFKRKNIDLAELESDLSLDVIDIYNDRDFWHMPGKELFDYPTLIHYQKTKIHELLTEIETLKNQY